jgi:PIN domain nuclease of toxin-antitoxin system
MATDFVVDAHALVWFLEGNSRLGSAAKSAMNDPASVLHLPIIALAEACWVVEKKRCAIPDMKDLLHDVDNDSRIILVPFDRHLLDFSCTLNSIQEMHDRIIAATLLALQATGVAASLLTRDPDIKASGIGPIIWE